MIFDLWARWLGFTARPIDSRPLRLLKSFVALAIIGALVAMMVRGASDAILYPTHLGGIAAKPANWLLLDWGAHTGPLLLGLVLVALVFVVADVLTRPALVVGLIAYAHPLMKKQICNTCSC